MIDLEFVLAILQRLLHFTSCNNSQNCATFSGDISVTSSIVKSAETNDVHFSEPRGGSKACFICGCFTEDRRSVE